MWVDHEGCAARMLFAGYAVVCFAIHQVPRACPYQYNGSCLAAGLETILGH